MSEYQLEIGQRVAEATHKPGKKRKKGVIRQVWGKRPGVELFEVKWNGDWSGQELWYQAEELKPIGRGSSAVKTVPSKKRRKRWWDDIDWGFSNRPSYKWRSNVEKVDELLKELTTPPQDAEQHIL